MSTEPLPIGEVLADLLDVLRENQAVVLTAPPGSGKTTRIPPALVESGICGRGRILLLQPRRVAARAAAAWMAGQRGEEVGQTIGYKIRFDERSSSATNILVVTEGILTRFLLADPLLEGTACVILDEFHERSVHADLALAFCRELLDVRDDFRLMVMSATLQCGPVARFLGDCPIIGHDARPFDVSVEHVQRAQDGSLSERAALAVKCMTSGPEDDGGDLLVFLPGAREIEKTRRILEREGGEAIDILPLYGALPAAEQDRALLPGKRRRIVLATNIAETSLTVPGVTTVIDSGLVKQLRYDTACGLDRLELVPISKQSARQRAGRAGRTASGRVFRLWTAHDHRGRPEADEPEIRRVDLAAYLPAVLAFQPGDPSAFPFFEPPGEDAVAGALEILRMLGAVEANGFALTDRGRSLLRLPIHPRLGAMILAARKKGIPGRGALLAALLGEGLPRRLEDTGRVSDSDLILFAEELGAGDDPARRKRVERTRNQLARLPGCEGKERSASERDQLAVVLAGFPDRVCKRLRPLAPEAVMVGGHGVRLSETSSVKQAGLFVALDVDAGRRGRRSRGMVRLASAVDEGLLEEQSGSMLTEETLAEFDPDRQAVVGKRRLVYRDLVIGEQLGVPSDPAATADILVVAAKRDFASVFRPDRFACTLRDRILFAARHMPEISWPDLSEDGLRAWLPDLCVGKTSFDELRRTDWVSEIRRRLGRLGGLLDEQVPERIVLPRGHRARIDYAAAFGPQGAPVLAVRIQQAFGLRQTPRVARGRVPLLVQLLAPNGRPAQVTADLESFWRDTYPQVRKELRARYPKHAWPEKPH